MTDHDQEEALERALAQVSENRRDFLKQLLAGAAVGLPLISGETAAQPVFPFKGAFLKGGGEYPSKGGSYGYPSSGKGSSGGGNQGSGKGSSSGGNQGSGKGSR